MTNPIKKLLMEDDGEVFSASNSDFYHVTTGQALQSMNGWTSYGNMVLRGGRTSTYTVIAGQRHIVEAMADFRFDREFINYARSRKRPDGKVLLNPDYLDTLAGQPFACNLDMMPDGSIAFPGPIGRVWGDPTQGKWIDTIISDFLRRGSSVATKAARLKWVADKGGYLFAENSMRRSNDAGGLLTAEVAVMVGLAGTSNMRAAMANGMNAVGTMDHYYVMEMMGQFFELNLDLSTTLDNQRLAQRHAFRCFMKEFPDYGMLLIDTIGVDIGLEDAIIVLKEFQPKHYSVRIDSGDLAAGAFWCRERLDAEKLHDVQISLTGGLRAVNLDSLHKKGVPFKSSGIGEYLQFGGERQRKSDDLYEAPVNVEIVTKGGYLKAPSGNEYRLSKLSETASKTSHPGMLDRYRLVGQNYLGELKLLADVEVDLLETGDMDGRLERDISSLRLDTHKPKVFPQGTMLERPIVPLLRGPELVDPSLLDVATSRARFDTQFGMLAEHLKEVDGSHSGCPAGIEREHYFRGYKGSLDQQVVQRIER